MHEFLLAAGGGRLYGNWSPDYDLNVTETEAGPAGGSTGNTAGFWEYFVGRDLGPVGTGLSFHLLRNLTLADQSSNPASTIE